MFDFSSYTVFVHSISAVRDADCLVKCILAELRAFVDPALRASVLEVYHHHGIYVHGHPLFMWVIITKMDTE